MLLIKRNLSILLALVFLLFGSLACRLLTVNLQATPTSTPTEVPTPAVSQLQENDTLAPTAEPQTSPQVKITFTEAQLTSIVASALQSQQETMLEDPQVLLGNGQIQVLGTVHQSGLKASLKIVMTLSADNQGRLHYHIVSGNLGPLPLPQSMLDQIKEQLDEAIGNNLNPEINNLFVENITISDGSITVTGHKR